MKKLTKKQQQTRRTVILTELANMSHNGWRNALPSDYLPLEAELRALEGKSQHVSGWLRSIK